MEADRFDRLARIVGQPRSRRSLTRLLGGVGLGAVLAVAGTTETLAAKRNPGKPCTKRRQCKTRTCVGSAGHKVCGCSPTVPCPDGFPCVNRRCTCVPITPPFGGSAGACSSDAQCCDNGSCCDFGEGAACYDLPNNFSACGTTCANAVNCVNDGVSTACSNGVCIV